MSTSRKWGTLQRRSWDGTDGLGKNCLKERKARANQIKDISILKMAEQLFVTCSKQCTAVSRPFQCKEPPYDLHLR